MIRRPPLPAICAPTCNTQQAFPRRPLGQDPILWVLRSYKKGFCNYYASAEVLMLRSIGIPARLAVGFAHGDLEGDTYIVHQRDAHAWPEVYFPGAGWLEFEPTVSQEPIVRPSGSNEAGGITANPQVNRPRAREEGAFPEAAASAKPAGLRVLAQTVGLRLLLLIVPILSAALLLALVHGLDLWQRLPIYLSKTFEGSGAPRLDGLSAGGSGIRPAPIERAFASINWSLALMRRPQPVAATPAERARLLSELLPTVSEQIWLLEHELESSLYMQGIPDLARARRAAVLILIRSLGWRIQRLLGAFQGSDVYSPRGS